MAKTSDEEDDKNSPAFDTKKSISVRISDQEVVNRLNTIYAKRVLEDQRFADKSKFLRDLMGIEDSRLLTDQDRAYITGKASSESDYLDSEFYELWLALESADDSKREMVARIVSAALEEIRRYLPISDESSKKRVNGN